MQVGLSRGCARAIVADHFERLPDEYAVHARGTGSSVSSIDGGLLVFPLKPLRPRCAGTLSREIETTALEIEFKSVGRTGRPATEVDVRLTQHLVLIAGLLAALDVMGHLGTNVVADLFRSHQRDWEEETRARHALLSAALQPLIPHALGPQATAYRGFQSEPVFLR